jgi:hypothetical protein
MGCFSYLCKVSGKPALSTSFDGSPVHLFLLIKGKVVEHMFGNYDSYGRVFKADKDDSFEWTREWGSIVSMHFDESDNTSGIAMILHDHYDGTYPTTISDNDPDQGWGGDHELMGDTSSGGFPNVELPYHKILVDKSEDLKEEQTNLMVVDGSEGVKLKKRITIMLDADEVNHQTKIFTITIKDGGLVIKKRMGELTHTSLNGQSIKLT